MKNYQDVVKDRFDSEEDVVNSIYSPHHPIGKYVRKILFNRLSNFLIKHIDSNNDFKKKKLLDLGCGNGGMLAFFIDKGFSPKNSIGVDLSQSRINRAEQQNPGVTFIQADILDFDLNGNKFYLITSFDLFSHLKTKEQIIKGLSNIFNHLENDGVFLWYDIYSKDHFATTENSDSWGFNAEQMILLAKESGFEVVHKETFFKNFFNRYHSIYQVKRFSPGIVKILETILPGIPGNIMMVFKKTQ